MADKPAFDPSQPFDVVKPPFDPSQPFTAAPDSGSSAMGVAKSLGVGAAQGGIGLAGMPGDLATLAQKGASKLPDIPAPAPDSVLDRLAQFLKDESAKSANLPAAQGSGDLPGSYIPPTSAQLQGSVEGATGPFYKPQGALEETAAKVGQFLPAMVGGPESLATKALTRVAAPAIASEAAGQATEGTAAQPYAELAGALAGGAGASAGLNKFNALIAARKAAAEVPSALETKAASQLLYKHPDVAAVQIKPEAMSSLADTINADLQNGSNSGFRPANEPKVFNAIDELRSPSSTQETIKSAATRLENGDIFPGINHAESTEAAAKSKGMNLDDFMDNHTDAQVQQGFLTSSGRFVNRDDALKLADKAGQVQPHSPETKWWNNGKPGLLLPGGLSSEVMQNPSRVAKVADLDNVRQVLGGLAKEKDSIGQPTRQAAAASRAIGHIDNFLPNLQQSDLLAGDAAAANAKLQDARANWSAYKKSSQVQNLLGNAELNATSANSGGNIQNSIKQAFKPLLKNGGSKVSSWTDDEKAALNKIVRGTWTGSAARAAGNLLGGGGGLGMLLGGAAGYEEGGLPGAATGMVAGRLFKRIGNASTLKAVNKLDFLIRAKSPEALKIAAQNPQITQALPSKSVQALRTLILADPTLAQQSSQQPSQANAY